MAPPGRTRCRNGEVWTSPCRESPRLPLRSQRSGGTSSPKADGLYKSCWRIAAQQWATLDTRPGSVGASGAQRARCTLRWSRLRAASVKGGPVTRALPCSRALTRQPDDTGGSSRRKEKGNLFSKNGAERGWARRRRQLAAAAEREGENQAQPGMSPSHRQKRGFSTFWGKPCKITRNLIKSTVQIERLFGKRGKSNGHTMVKARI